MRLEAKDYFKHLMITYRAAHALVKQKQEHALYRIAKLPEGTDKNVHFQIIGKSVILKMLPEEIMRQDILLGFSRAEIAIITHIGTKSELNHHHAKPRNNFFKIIKQIFSNEKTLFLVEKEHGEIAEYAANDLLSDSSLAEKFNGIDGIKIGYTAAEEHYNRIEKLKNK